MVPPAGGMWSWEKVTLQWTERLRNTVTTNNRGEGGLRGFRLWTQRVDEGRKGVSLGLVAISMKGCLLLTNCNSCCCCCVVVVVVVVVDPTLTPI